MRGNIKYLAMYCRYIKYKYCVFFFNNLIHKFDLEENSSFYSHMNYMIVEKLSVRTWRRYNCVSMDVFVIVSLEC